MKRKPPTIAVRCCNPACRKLFGLVLVGFKPGRRIEKIIAEARANSPCSVKCARTCKG
jgi:hypothetical protein